jgi:thiol-disulfide isomerase/thioredoxin
MKNKFSPNCALLLALCTIVSFVALAATVTAEVATEEAICPVCRVHEGETEAEVVEASADYKGHTYGFCSTKCRDTFLEAPEGYLPPVFPRPAASFVVHDLEGANFSSEELQGRVVLLDFWATWCQPCVDDLPRLTQLHERHKESGLTVLSVSIDEGKNATKKIARMMKKRKATHPVYLDSADSTAWAAYNVRVVPAQFLIDAEGNIVAQWSGKTDLDLVEAEITRLLEN